MAQDLRVPMDPVLEAFGVAAVVTRPAPSDTPIAARLVWLPPVAVDVPVGDATARRMEPQRLAALAYAEVATVPRRTRIVAPEVDGGPDRTWRVDATDRIEHDHVIVVVVPED